MLDPLLDPFAQTIAQRALVETVLLGLVCGPLGVWIVLFRQCYTAESVSHSMLPGLVLAASAGIPLGLGAAAGLAVAALLISLVSRQHAVGPDAAVAVTVTGLFGLGSLLALSPETPLRVGELLFGDPLGVSAEDLVATAALATVVAGGLAIAGRDLTLAGFDAQAAPSLGTSPARAGLLLLLLLVATVLIAVQALGNLLVVAIVVGPAVAALRIATRIGRALATAALLAVGAGVAGIYLSHYAEIAAGAAIALCAIAPAALALLLQRPGSRASRHAGGSPVEALGAGG